MYTYTIGQGEHTFRWSYEKDVYVSGGSDCAWLDNIIFPPVSLISGIEASTVDYTHIWPNPNQGNLNLEYYSDNNGQLNIQILSIDGKLIYQEKVNITQGNNSINLELNNAENGVYILSIFWWNF